MLHIGWVRNARFLPQGRAECNPESSQQKEDCGKDNLDNGSQPRRCDGPGAQRKDGLAINARESDQNHRYARKKLAERYRVVRLYERGTGGHDEQARDKQAN